MGGDSIRSRHAASLSPHHELIFAVNAESVVAPWELGACSSSAMRINMREMNEFKEEGISARKDSYIRFE
jgi:hypothetical protein